ncbi:hypothetical protein [Mucilaginibacter rubeus]|uniref:Uncharacterized protein n=1 Tax=Mucilaginibacter rubeus TaxID=2027860 RepID=A0A5C1I7G1_9SPHI|nr:hypothetical protein [Mucilaginibacter rubeus]QEM13488.1 hypothetical protein DEO27_026910 [Mucilaginibacter rubeus]
MQVEIKARQTPHDIAIQCGGTLDSIFEAAELMGIDVTDEVKPGTIVTAPAIAVQDVADYFRKYKISPASATTELEALLPEGVEFWAIEYDFIVS